MPRTSRAPHRVIGLILMVPLLLSGCLWYFYPADPAVELLLYDSFEGLREDVWNFGVGPGYTEDASIINGRFEVYGPRHFLQTRYRFPLDLTVLVEWSVTDGDVSSLYPDPNADDPDFAVTIDGLDLTVELSLYRSGPDSTRIDTVRILDRFGVDMVESVSVETTGVTRGLLEVRLIPNGDDVDVVVSVPKIDLEVSALTSLDGLSDSIITIGLSGLFNDPRSLEEVLFIGRPGSSGGLK